MPNPELPEPPINVRLVYADDTEVPVDTVYDGPDENGIHMWSVVNAPSAALRVVNIKIEELPARTGVSFPMGLP